MLFIKKIILAISIFGVLSAQDKVLQLERITENDGLLNTTVECIFQDSFGFMWFGTWKGLTRYDGTEFRFYKIFPAHPRFVSSNEVTALAEDKDGFIWIGTMRGLIRLEPFSGAIRTYRHDARNVNTPSNDFITSLFADKEAIWFGTQGGGLNKLTLNPDGGAIHFSHYKFDSGSYAKSGWNLLHDLIGDQRGGKDLLWIATAEGLIRFKKKTGNFERFFRLTKSPVSNELKVIHQDKRKRIWVGTANGFISLLSEDAAGAITFHDYAVYSNNVINHICDADSTHLWLGGYNERGLICFNTNSGECTNYTYKTSKPNSLINNYITSLYRDCSGILWVGSANSLSRFDPSREKFKQSVALPAMHNKYYHSRKTPEILKSGKDRLWLGKHGYGLICINKANNDITNYRHDETDASTLCNDFIQVIFEDHLGTIWVGTQNGLDRFAEKSRTFTHYSDDTQKADPSHFLPADLINDIYEDRDGRLWICTSAGISRLNRRKDYFIHYLYGSSRQLRKTCYYLGVLYQDSKKQYWLGGRGLFRFYPEKNKIQLYFHQNGDTLLWINEMVSVIHEDSRGSLWIGTSGGGLYRLNEDDRTLRLTENNGFSGDYIMAILEDEQGFLWVSTYMGLSKVDPCTGTFKNYGPKDGLTYNYFQLRSASKDISGKMYLGQISGYTEFDPSRIKDNPNESQIIITEISIFDRDIKPEIPARGYSQFILPHNQNMLTFKYVLLNYTNSRLNNYKYLLEGVDKDWNYVGKRRVAAYSNLPAGEYIFHVKGCNSDGVWNEQDASVKIIILPPWWRTWWFRSILFLLFVVLVLTAHRLRVRHLRRDRQRQRDFSRQLIQSQEAERKRIASGLHDSLGQNLLIVHNEIQLLAAEHRDLKWEITPIVTDIKESINEVREISYNLHPHLLDRLGLNKALESVIKKVSKSSGIKIEYELNEVEKMFSKGKQIHFYRIIQEALNNIVKHARATEVKILIVKQRKNIVATISDNGRGFNVRAVMSRSNAKVGFGLANMRERARLIGGRLRIVSSPGKETEIILRIPIYTGD